MNTLIIVTLLVALLVAAYIRRTTTPSHSTIEYKRTVHTATGLYWFDCSCVYDTWVHEGDEYIGLRDELLAKVLRTKGRDGYFMYLIQVEQENIWLANDYVEDNLLTPLTDREAEVIGVLNPEPLPVPVQQENGRIMYRYEYMDKKGEHTYTTWGEYHQMVAIKRLLELGGGTNLKMVEGFIEY